MEEETAGAVNAIARARGDCPFGHYRYAKSATPPVAVRLAESRLFKAENSLKVASILARPFKPFGQ